MRLITAVLAVSVLANCQTTPSNNTETTPKDTMSAAPATPSEPTPNTLTDAQKADGWQLLFDGTTTKGWHVYNKKSDGSAWKVADGALYLDTAQKKDWQVVGGGDIVTDEEYENYHFKVEWKVTPGGNSGLIFNINESPKYEHTWHTGPEMQVLDNAAHRDASIVKHRAGDLYDLITSSPETVKPAGEWNLAEIVSNKGTLEFYLNGTKVVSTTMWDDSWKKLIAGSKFKTMKDFGTFKKGRIGLQDHGDLVWFRNIMIKKL